MWCGKVLEGNPPWLPGTTDPQRHTLFKTGQGRFEIFEVRTNIMAIGLGGALANDLNQVFWDAAAEGRGCDSDSRGVSRVVYKRDAAQRKNVMEVLVEPEAGSQIDRIILGSDLRCPGL